MSYQEVYKQKLTTADEAVKAVKSGDWVDYGWSVCSADALDKACLLYTSPSPRDRSLSRMPSSA